jgi:hypothetical protein
MEHARALMAAALAAFAGTTTTVSAQTRIERGRYVVEGILLAAIAIRLGARRGSSTRVDCTQAVPSRSGTPQTWSSAMN